ncbi:hypothetical protein [Streptomyces boninensis]|uniref:hypothetical protein n=1 Tax=Streptomyces boninensis TaxID=2039455 RepID=UPI003B228579
MSSVKAVKTAAPALAAALLLAACGGSDEGGKSGEIKGAGDGEKSPSATPSAEQDPKAPEFDFPRDVKVQLDSATPTDKAAAAVLRDHGYAVQSIQLAFAKGNPELPLLYRYVKGDALVGWSSGITKFKKQGKTITGKVLKTEPSPSDFIQHVSTMSKDKNGAWKMIRDVDREESKTCRR